MKDARLKEENNAKKVSIMNKIFENLVADASDLIEDLNWSVKTYLLFGLMSFLFGVQTVISNIELLQTRLYIPLFVGGALMFCGFGQIFNYFRLRKKYARLFEVQKDLKKP